MTAAPLDLVLARLEAYHLRPSGRDRWRARCPAHEGDNPSTLSVGIGQTGQVLLKCWAGCSIDQVAGALSLQLEDLFPDRGEAGQGAGPLARCRLLSAGQALDLLTTEALVLYVVGSDMMAKREITQTEYARLVAAVGRIQDLGREARQ